MKVKQYPYLSPQAVELRRRDGIPPWSIHVCEVECFEPIEEVEPATFRAEVLRVKALRDALERGGE